MKSAIRALALLVVLAGATAASLCSSAPTAAVPSRQATVAALPIPACGPNVPNCPKGADSDR